MAAVGAAGRGARARAAYLDLAEPDLDDASPRELAADGPPSAPSSSRCCSPSPSTPPSTCRRPSAAAADASGVELVDRRHPRHRRRRRRRAARRGPRRRRRATTDAVLFAVGSSRPAANAGRRRPGDRLARTADRGRVRAAFGTCAPRVEHGPRRARAAAVASCRCSWPTGCCSTRCGSWPPSAAGRFVEPLGALAAPLVLAALPRRPSSASVVPMPITPDHAGKAYAPTAPYEVSRAKIAEFADALGDDAAVRRRPTDGAPDLRRGRDERRAGTRCSPTRSWSWPAPGRARRPALPLSRPLRAGDVVTATLRIDKVRVRGAGRDRLHRGRGRRRAGEAVLHGRPRPSSTPARRRRRERRSGRREVGTMLPAADGPAHPRRRWSATPAPPATSTRSTTPTAPRPRSGCRASSRTGC